MDATPSNTATSPRTQQLDDNENDDDDGRIIDNEPPLELQPKFTEQDAQRELATLTIQELTELQSDLTGIQAITNGFTGLGLGGDTDTGGINVYSGDTTGGPNSSPPAPLSANDCSRIDALEHHMSTLPAQSTAAYFRATTKCPDEVSNERKLMFLQCEENSIPLAAQRLALYWQYRLDGFGEHRCFEPMTLAGAMKDEVINMAKSGFYQLMPNTDAAGRAIIYANSAKRDYSLYSVKQEVMWLTYLLEVVVQHKCLRSRGFVLLLDASNATEKHRTRQSQQYMQRAHGAFPIRTCSVHMICKANPLVTYVLYPVVQRLLPKHMRLRTRFHRGSGDDLLRSLATFNLPRDRLPSAMGGRVLLDINQFLIDRFQLESSCVGINLDLHIDNPSAGREATAATHQDTEDYSKPKRTWSNGDPRMAKAAQAKQEDPDLSLYDALISGGYAFPQKVPGQRDFDVFDEDGVSLRQRKNNLCTRLKRTQTKNETKKANEPIDDEVTSANQSQAAAVMARRDSFDEEIEGLPGLDGLDDWIRRL